MSDWDQTIKPISNKVYADLVKLHGRYAGAVIEAMEIARRRAEIDQTETAWRLRHNFKPFYVGGELLVSADKIFTSLVVELNHQRAVHVLTGLERCQTRAQWAADMIAWRGEMSVADAAAILGLSVEDIQAIESQSISVGPGPMRLIRPALRRIREDLLCKSH